MSSKLKPCGSSLCLYPHVPQLRLVVVGLVIIDHLELVAIQVSSKSPHSIKCGFVIVVGVDAVAEADAPITHVLFDGEMDK